MIQYRSISRVLGIILMVYGTMMSISSVFSIYYQQDDLLPILISSALTIVAGFVLFIKTKNHRNVGKREGYLIVALGWVFMTLTGMLPFLISGEITSVTNAFFETISGLTTTGASTINDIEAVSKGVLFWRSFIQWIGGMGIIVLTVALLPLLGIGGVELFIAEVPGPTNDKIHPRIRDTAKSLWFVYVILTFVLCMILWMEGMTFYEAINHALTTMATGGFSTKNASIAHYNSPLIQYTIIFFMCLAGVNYTLLYFGMRGKLKKMWSSEEFRTYLYFIFVGVLITTAFLLKVRGGSVELAFRESLFQFVSIITTTGFVSADYTSWSPTFTLFFFLLIFVGACAGSTSGGIKIIRHLVFVKNSMLEFKRLLHPRALIRMKIDKQIVAPKTLTHILVFLLIYLLCFISGSLLVSFLGLDLVSAFGAVATCLSNVGPGIGEVGPLNNFAALPDSVKWVLSFLMLLGRLELFTILILFTTYFWKSN